MALLFEQLPDESDKAFAAFSVYLGQGPARSLGKTADTVGKAASLIGKWSKLHQWAARVRAHGEHMAQVQREATEAAVRTSAEDWTARQVEQREQEWNVRCELLEAGREALRRWREDPKRSGTLEGIARVLELVSKLGRLAAGMSTDHTETMTSVAVALDPEWQLALKKVYGVDAAGGAGAAGSVIDLGRDTKTLTEGGDVDGNPGN